MFELLVSKGVLVKEELQYWTNDRKFMRIIKRKLGKDILDTELRGEDKEWEEANGFIINDQLNKLIEIEKNGKDLSKMYYKGEPAICIAVNYNKIDIVKHLINKYDCKKLVDRFNGRNALHYAAISFETKIEMLKCLLQKMLSLSKIVFYH